MISSRNKKNKKNIYLIPTLIKTYGIGHQSDLCLEDVVYVEPERIISPMLVDNTKYYFYTIKKIKNLKKKKKKKLPLETK